MKGLEIKTTPVLVLGIQILLLARFVGGSSWYSGCIRDNPSSNVSESLFQNQTHNAVFIPSTCARSCHDRGFLYAGLQDAYNCRCSNGIEAFGEGIDDEKCNITCGNASLPCGGDSAVSVYSVDGPYLLRAELSWTQNLVQEGTTVRFEARVSLATATVTNIGVNGLNSSHFENIEFLWSVDGEVIRKTSHRHGNLSTVDSFVHTFNHHGNGEIDVEVRNTISSLTRTTSIMVVRPLPSDLQVILQHSQGDSPSCVPASDATAPLPAVAVFVGEEVEFQASVRMGTNLTFTWVFEEHDGVNGTERFAEDSECEGIACLQDTQVYTFSKEGRYSVLVNASNHLGNIHQILQVVVVNREITNLTMALSSDSAYINEVNSSLGLVISVTTTARQQALLEVDYGDGSVHNYSMYDVNDTFITAGDEDNRHPYLTASYGEGCTLFIALSHTYRHPGVFNVQAKVFQLWNDQSVASTKLDSAVIIQEKLGQVTLETQHVYSVHSLANFTLLTPVITTNMTYSWSVSFSNETGNLNCPHEPTCLHNFTEPGHYVLRVVVSNLVSVSHAHKSVLVQAAISGLNLTSGRSGILATGTTLQFVASVQSGSDIHFTWHFSDILGATEQRNELLNSHANHTYYTSGVYNVSITASNQVGSVTAHLPRGIIVQDPVLGLSLTTTGPTILTQPTYINATLLQGTQVTISTYAEEGPLTPDVEFFENDRTYALKLRFSNPGVFHVRVVASNDVSSENGTVCVVVQERVGTVSIQAIYPGKSQVVLLARLIGSVPERTDVVYRWQVRGENITSASPLLRLSAASDSELVIVQASNQVDEAQAEIMVDSSTMQTIYMYSLDCPPFAEEGTPVTMMLQISGNNTSTPVDIIIDHADDTSNVSYTVSPDIPFVWNHTYHRPGVYLVNLWFTMEGKDLQAQTGIVIQGRISNVALMGPHISRFLGFVAMQTWEALPSSGTHILYTWTVLPIETDYSHGTETSTAVVMSPIQVAGSHGKVSLPFHAPGRYNISLTASNLISSVSLHTETTLQQPILHTTVLVETTLLGTPSTYQVMIKGGPPFQIRIDFGTDGESVSVDSEELAQLENEIIDYLFDPPMCVYVFNVTYPNLGWYESSFRISNQISEETVTATAKVEEWITGLTLRSLSPSLVTIRRDVILEASVETGNDIDFSWDFQDEISQPSIQNYLNTSRATHTFSLPGSYQVSVTVSNHLQPQPLTITYPGPFLVQEPVFALELKPPLGHLQGAALYGNGVHRATDNLAFRAQCWGSHVVFYFDYGDGTVQGVDGTLDSFGMYSAHGNHQYVREGNYIVTVTASNHLSNETRRLARPYYVQAPPTILHCGQPHYIHAFGNVSHLSVLADTGSHLFYNWSMGDQTDYIDVGLSVSHMYRSSGRYEVTVVAYNKVERAEVTCSVSIEDRIQGVELKVGKTLHQTQTDITLRAVTVTDSALWYQWDMGNARDVQITSVNTLIYRYNFPGRYYVTVVAGNYVSNATSLPVELTLQDVIQKVTIRAQTATLINQSTLFKARLLGSDVNLVWDFGDGTDKVYTIEMVFYHTYNRTGEFFIHLDVSNRISNTSISSKIFVLTTMCYPPVLDIVGEDPRSVKRSEDIRIEAEVEIDCDITNVALYTWVVTHASNQSVVDLDPTVASLDQCTLFIPRRYLPYGSYLFSLDVAMNGTIVYSHDSTSIHVTKSALKAIIEGGTQRYFSRDMTAMLNGSLSYDPDDPTADDLEYTWTCHPLGDPTAPCFNTTAIPTIDNHTFALPSHNPVLTFPISWLLQNGAWSFVFALRVGKEDRGHAEVTQVVTLVHEDVGSPKQLQVSIDCPKCQDGIINSNDQLTMEAVCPHCNANTTYGWELYIVLDGTMSVSTSVRRCSEWLTSNGQSLIANDSLPLPVTNTEEDGNIINQSTQSTPTFTPQNNVSNVIDPRVTPLANVEGPPADLNSTLPSNQTVVATSGDSTSIPVATVSPGTDLVEEEFEEGFDGPFQEELGGGVTEELDPVQREEKPEATEDVGNSSVGNSSFWPNVGTENTTELAVMVEEAGGSYEEAGGSFEEDVEATAGRFTEVTESFQENELNGTENPLDLPETLSANATERSLLETFPPANSSLTEPPVGPQNQPSTPGEAPDSNHDDTDSLAGQDTQNTSQPVAGNDRPDYDYYEEDYPEEFLSSIYEAGLDTPPQPDSDTGTEDDDTGDPVIDPDLKVVINEHLVSKSVQQRILRPENTTTGLTSRVLTIREGMLEENRTYALVVHVQSRENGVVRIGEARQYVFINRGPGSGRCFLTPLEGNEMDTFFTIDCYGWQDKHTPIQYEVSYSLNKTGDLTILYFGMRDALQFQLPAGYAENGHKVYVKVAIVDALGGKTTVCSISIKVLPKLFNPGESIEEFLYNVTVGPANLLRLYIEQGDQYMLSGVINRVACMLNHQPTLQESRVNYTKLLSLRRQIRCALVSAVLALPMRDQLEIQQSSSATAASSYVPLELQVKTVIIASHSIDLCKDKALANLALVGQLNVDILVALTSTMSSVVSALAMEHTQTIRLDQHKAVIEVSIGAVAQLLQSHLQQQKPDKDPLFIQTSSVDLLGARQSSLLTVNLTAGQNAFLLPSTIEQNVYSQNTGVMMGSPLYPKTDTPCWDVDMVTYQANPYTWGEGADKVTAGVSSLNLHSCTGLDLRVDNLTAGQEIIFEVLHSCGSLRDSLTCNLTIDKAFMNVHEFNVSQENMAQTFQIMVRLSPEARRTFPLKLIMSYDRRPTPTVYDRSWLYENEGEDLVVFLPPNAFNESGTYYLALIDAEYGSSSYRQEEIRIRQYLIRVWWGECLYWNTDIGEDIKDAWIGDGCQLMESSVYEKTRCKCNHLTSFGVTFLPVSLLLDFVNLARFETPNANPITCSFTAGAFSIYLILLVYCYFADKHDEKKQSLIYLWDNQPSDRQYYEITVETGMRTGAGTTARVSVVIHGEEGHSKTKELICNGRPIFEKNSRDRFIVSVPESLGNIHRVHVWHNNAGHSPSWYLSRIAVRDLITGHKWYFICERWFAVEEDDGKIERELEVLSRGVGFQKAFFAKLYQYFADYYLWSSIFTRPPYSVFTRVQRLTCCLSISMTFLCINTIWYQHLDKQEADLGLIDVSLEAVLVGIVTALLAIPINFPIIMIFRRARPHSEKSEEDKNYKSVKTTIELPESAAPVETILSHGKLWSGTEDQSDVTLEELQEWAQEKWKNRLKGSFSHSHSQNSHGSFESLSLSSGMYDDNNDDEILSSPSISSSSNKLQSEEISDSGVSSPDSGSLRSCGYVSGCRQADHKRLSNPKIWLPSWWRMLAWAVCIVIIPFSAVVSICYGYSFSHVKSVYWMQSLYFSFLQCIFVTQPAVMLMFTIVKSVRHRNNIHIFDHYDDNIDLMDKKSLERSRLETYEQDMDKAIAVRQRSRYLRFARPPQEKELQKAKEKMLKEKNMWVILKDMIMYSTLFACLMWMAYGRDVAYHHPVNYGVRQTFLQTPHPFTNISSISDLWLWLHDDLVDTLYWEKWYNADAVLEGKHSIMNGESILLGKASLRQLRVHHQSCQVARPTQSLFLDCKASYTPGVRSTEPYGPRQSWTHSWRHELKRYVKWGFFGSYEGGGFAVTLNSTREEALTQLEFLQNNSWIDDQTRAVIVEFTIYNAPTNLYTAVGLLAEMPGTGAINPVPNIESVLLHRYESMYDYFIMCCELLFLLLVAVSGKREVQKLVKIRAAYFKSTWSWMEMGLIILSLTYFVMYVCRFMYVNNATHHLRITYMEEFVDMSLLAFWDQILKDLLASLIFLVAIKLMRLLRFNQTVAKFGAVIDGAIKEILSFALFMVILEAAFACLGVLLFSSYFYPLKHLYISANLLNAMIVGHPADYQDLQAQFPMLWGLFYFSYVVTMTIFMSGLIKAILCHSYRQVKQQHVEAVGGKEVIWFFWDKFLVYVGLRQLPEGEKPATLPTEYTMAEIEYQVDELLFRMTALSHQHGLPQKPYGYYDDSDGTHGMEDGLSSTCSELNLFDNSRLEDRVQKIETHLYSQNPELRELLDGNCFTDEDTEKQLRAHLEMEIFRHLQLQRQEEYRLQHELHDSGHDTQSTSEHMELGSDNASLDQQRAPFNVSNIQGQVDCSKPSQNLGTTEMQSTSMCLLTNQKQAWDQRLLTNEGHVTQEASRIVTPQDKHPHRLQNTQVAYRRPFTAGTVDKRNSNMASESKLRKDQQLSSSEVLYSQSSSSCDMQRTDSLSSHSSDLVTSKVNEASLESSRNWVGGVACRDRIKPNLEELVRDHPEGIKPKVERPVSAESFPLPNALDSLSSSSGNEDGRHTKKHHKESESRHRLRKTRSRGKGKGRCHYGEGAYFNEAFSTDSEDNTPVIHMGPMPFLHNHNGV